MKYILGLFLLFSTTVRAEIVERIVAIVNEDIITLTDIDNYRSRLKKGTLVDDLLITDKKVISRLLKDDKKLIDLLINEKIIDSEVSKQGLAVTIEHVEKEVRNISKKNGISRAQLKQALGVQGIKFSDYQDFIKTRLERQSLIEKNVSSKIQITDDDIYSYASENPGNSRKQLFEYTLSQILLSKKNGGYAGAKKRADKVLKQLNGDLPFETVADRNNEDQNSAKGGLLGTFKEGEMLTEFEKSVHSMKVGDYSNPIRTKFGYHVLKLVDKKSISNPTFLREKEKIRGLLYQQAFKKQFEIWLDQKKQEAFIRINS